MIITFDDGFSECFSLARPLLLKLGIPCTFFVTTDLIDNQHMSNIEKSSLCIDKFLLLDTAAQNQILNAIGHEFNIDWEGQSFIEWIKADVMFSSSGIDQVCEILEVDIANYLEQNRPYLTSDEIKTLRHEGFMIGAHSLRHQLFDQLSAADIEMNISKSCEFIQQLTGDISVPFAFPHSGKSISRNMLDEIRSHHDHVGLIFDGNGISRDSEFIISRFCADSPYETKPGHSNLSIIIKRVYIDEFVQIMRSKFNKWSG